MEATNINLQKQDSAQDKSAAEKFKRICAIAFPIIYQCRKLLLAAPVLFYALKLAAYNSANLPDQVGIYLQTNGTFLQMIDKSAAISAPLAVTVACLVMMCCSRKTIYPWVISIFTLALPLLLLVSNTYPV